MQYSLLSDNVDISLYKSNSQKIRVLTENWVENYSFCPKCGCHINKYENNKPVADFYCKNCFFDFELKSKKNDVGNKIVDGAYGTMIERLNSKRNPHFFFMTYQDYNVKDFLLIPKHFFVNDIIEKRKPLSDTAKRAGWVGCNILLNKIPNSGRIFYIKDGEKLTKDNVINRFMKTSFLANSKPNLRGWTLDIMKCIDTISANEFTLEQMYGFERQLKLKYVENNFIKDKIRQQLQYLRDKGYIEFKGKGKYAKL